MRNCLVLQTDFGLVDGAVAAMKGVALQVDDTLEVFDLTHDITPYNIWEASYRLFQSVEYWPSGTVFVSVVDPGVGSDRKSVVARTSRGQYIVTPDNGTLTHIAAFIGIEELREIDETRNRRRNTENSYTFHGRDVYAFTGAKLASTEMSLEQVGPVLDISQMVRLELGSLESRPGLIRGCIDILDIRFGSLWTNIPREDFLQALGASIGDEIDVSITKAGIVRYHGRLRYTHSFAEVKIGEPLVYVNSLYRMAVAINQGSFSSLYKIDTGTDWIIEFTR